ncbi:MAG: VOC family protein [Ferruginibacter sp.]|nr:VOC family protein [Ferruginibacter sp.]
MILPEGSYTQIAYVVKNVEAAAAHWTKVSGAGPWFILEPETKNTIYRGQPTSSSYRLGLTFLGGTYIEMIQPTDDEPSIFKEILDLRGEGFHHISPQLSGLKGAAYDERCREMERRGLKLAMNNEVVHMGRAAYYDALDSIGGFIEVFEAGEGYSMVPYIQELHLAWDGKDPIRKMETIFGKF